MAEQRQLIYQVLLDAGKSPEEAKRLSTEIDKITKSANEARRATDDFSKAAKANAKLQENQARASGLAGAAAFELGRTISDLPFGIVAVTNNISQLGTLMAALVANANGVKGAFSALWKQIMGPAGVLIAFQAVTAAVTFFAQQSNKAKKEVDGLQAVLSVQGKTYEELSAIVNNANESDERRLEVLKALGQFNEEINKIVNDENLTVQERINLGNRLNKARIREREIQKAATDELVKRNKLYANITVSEEELQKRMDRRAKAAQTLERGYVEVMQNGVKVQKALNLEQRQQIETTLAGLDREIKAIEEGIPVREAIISQLSALGGQQETINDITEEYNKLTKSREQDVKDAMKVEEERLKIQEEALRRLQDQTDQAIKDEEASEIAQLNRAYEREIEAAKKVGADTSNIEAFYAAERLRVKDEFAEKRAKNERDTNYEIESAQRSHNVKMALLEAKLAGERIQQSDRTEKEILDAEIGILESRIKVLRILAQTSDVAKKSLDEALIVLDDLVAKRELASKDTAKKILGINEEDLKAGIELAQSALTSLSGILSAQADREIAIETNKTNAINDQLKARLANEQMSADERDKINQEIARNEATLVEKENAINKKRFEQEKAVNIALATVNTFSAATGVLAETKGGSFARIAGMIAVIGAGLAQVAMIAKQQFVGQAAPSPRLTGLGTSQPQGPAFNVVGASSQNQLAQAIAAQNATPIKTYVVSSDVTTSQELERKIVEGASI